VPTYDDDGNLLTDGRFNYEWDGENRLVKAEMIEAPDPYQAGPFWVYPPKLRVSYSYDYMGRLVRTFVEKNELFMGGVPVWETESDTRYVYDGWNVVVELDGEDSNAIVKKYTWGLDVSGSLQGAGGVGGLLACEDLKTSATSADDVQYVYAYDGNGNVMALTDSAQNPSKFVYDGTELARYDYDPYGNVLSASGAEADANRYRFSTKPQDAVTELFYYGYRWYHADWGRWVSRDPIGESGGTNVNSFLGNGVIGGVDFLGLKVVITHTYSRGNDDTFPRPNGNGAMVREPQGETARIQLFLEIDNDQCTLGEPPAVGDGGTQDYDCTCPNDVQVTLHYRAALSTRRSGQGDGRAFTGSDDPTVYGTPLTFDPATRAFSIRTNLGDIPCAGGELTGEYYIVGPPVQGQNVLDVRQTVSYSIVVDWCGRVVSANMNLRERQRENRAFPVPIVPIDVTGPPGLFPPVTTGNPLPPMPGDRRPAFQPADPILVDPPGPPGNPYPNGGPVFVPPPPPPPPPFIPENDTAPNEWSYYRRG